MGLLARTNSLITLTTSLLTVKSAPLMAKSHLLFKVCLLFHLRKNSMKLSPVFDFFNVFLYSDLICSNIIKRNKIEGKKRIEI